MVKNDKNKELQRIEMANAKEKIKSILIYARQAILKKPEDEIVKLFQGVQAHTIKLLDALRSAGYEKSFDWLKMMVQVCEALNPLVVVQPFTVCQEAHTMRNNDLLYRQAAIKDISRNMAGKLLSEGKHQLAVKAASISLRFSMAVDGLNSVKLIPAYLVLSEASIGLNDLVQAEEYLCHAEWTMLKSTDHNNGIKSKLFRKIGILHATKGDYESAQRLFAEDVYHGTEHWGPEDIQTTGGYFHMANVFFRLNKMDIADSLYSQVTDNWFKFLVNAVNKKIEKESKSALERTSSDDSLDKQVFHEDTEREGIQILNSVYEIREQSSKPNKEQFATICFNLAMFHYLVGNISQSQKLFKKGKLETSRMMNGYAREVPKLFEFEPPAGNKV